LGSCEEFRFITSPELTAYADAGAAVGSTGLVSTTGASIDVYPYLVMGENACYDVALKMVEGSSRKPIDVIHLAHNLPSKSDPLGQRGYVGASFWAAVKVVNGGWMGVIEAGTRALT
jgi:N4-gp56 family major capsid protein